MELLFVSFIAGVLTIAAPCIIPLLPVIVGGSVLHGNEKDKKQSFIHPIIIISSLIISIVVFSLLLKATTALLGIPTQVWSFLSGIIVVAFGISLLKPELWENVMIATNLQSKANLRLAKSQSQSGVKRDILLGASLGPVFNSCSPTYALIIAAILPVSFITGLSYLFAYALGLGVSLLVVSLVGHSVVRKFAGITQPGSVFMKVIGIIFVLVGVMLIFGLDKQFQTFILENGFYQPIEKLELLLQQ